MGFPQHTSCTSRAKFIAKDYILLNATLLGFFLGLDFRSHTASVTCPHASHGGCGPETPAQGSAVTRWVPPTALRPTGWRVRDPSTDGTRPRAHAGTSCGQSPQHNAGHRGRLPSAVPAHSQPPTTQTGRTKSTPHFRQNPTPSSPARPLPLPRVSGQSRCCLGPSAFGTGSERPRQAGRALQRCRGRQRAWDSV